MVELNLSNIIKENMNETIKQIVYYGYEDIKKNPYNTTFISTLFLELLLLCIVCYYLYKLVRKIKNG